MENISTPFRRKTELLSKRQDFILIQINQAMTLEQLRSDLQEGEITLRELMAELTARAKILQVPSPENETAIYLDNWTTLRKTLMQRWLRLEQEKNELLHKNQDTDQNLEESMLRVIREQRLNRREFQYSELMSKTFKKELRCLSQKIASLCPS